MCIDFEVLCGKYSTKFSITKPLQNQKLMIHVCHPKCTGLLHSLLQRFIKNDKVMRSKESTKRFSANKLVDLNIDDASHHKLIKFIKIYFFLVIKLLQV